MNYYERHIGDYIKDTVSLSMLEDGAYNRLIDQAYQTEEPLPLDKREIYRLARATSTAERKAVDYVLNKFWIETESGYVQKRIQTEIERYQDKQRKAKASADARWNKNKPQSDGNANASKAHDADDMRTHCDGNAHQTPDTSNQSPDPKHKTNTASETSQVVGTGHTEARATPVQISIAMRKYGVSSQPADPRLIALSEQGTAVETVNAACEAAQTAKPGELVGVGYVVAILKRWASEAAALDVKGAHRPTSNKQDSRAAAAASIGLGANRHEPKLIIDANE